MDLKLGKGVLSLRLPRLSLGGILSGLAVQGGPIPRLKLEHGPAKKMSLAGFLSAFGSAIDPDG